MPVCTFLRGRLLRCEPPSPAEKAGFWLCQGGGHDGFDGVHAVFGFVEDDGLGAFEDFVGDLHGGQTVFFADLLADGGAEVVEGGQAVHDGRTGFHAEKQ